MVWAEIRDGLDTCGDGAGEDKGSLRFLALEGEMVWEGNKCIRALFSELGGTT